MTTDTSTQGNMFQGADFPPMSALFRDYYSAASLAQGADISDWLAVALDTSSLMYADEDWRAMDETNWAVIRDSLASAADVDALPELRDSYRYQRSERGAAWTIEADADDWRTTGIVILRTLSGPDVVAVRPDAVDIIDEARQLARAVADYPLLDESAYSERDYEAWQDYAPTAWRYDEVMAAQREGSMPEAVAEAIEDMSEDDTAALLAVVSSSLDYWQGFTGDYSPSMLSVVRAYVRDEHSEHISDDYYRSSYYVEQRERVLSALPNAALAWFGSDVMKLSDGTRITGTLRTDDEGEPIIELAQCGACGFVWNDALTTGTTPAPSGRCPNEYAHDSEDGDQ